jgi:hypothetical protein
MKENRFHIIFLLLATASLTVSAQTQLFFSMGVVDRPSNEAKIAAYVNTINKSVNCLQVLSGLFAYYGIAGNKLFSLDCPTGPTIIRPEIRLFPNPATNYIRAQSNQLINDHPSLQLKVIDATGRTVMRQTVTNTQLYAGQSLYVGMIASGNYFLHIESGSLKQIIPFIKVN